jgi:putative nucleotidyltransferase with HDIG domain
MAMLAVGMSTPRGPVYRVLVVDDEGQVRGLLLRFLESECYCAAAASGGVQALEMLEREPFDVVLSDVNMPGMNGMSLLKEIRAHYPEVAVLMLTGCEDVAMAVDAMKMGALDYVLKPFDLKALDGTLRAAIARRAASIHETRRVARLEETVRRQTVKLRELLSRAGDPARGTLEALAAVLDARERETRAHSRRVAGYAVRLAEEFGIGHRSLEVIRRGALLHDIGKIGIPDHILLKPGSLTSEEWSQMRRHPEIGYWIVNGLEGLEGAARVVMAHHERFDGQGYPRGLRGEDIPVEARLFAVADSLDAITTDRPYHHAAPWEDARREIAAGSGGQFDPSAVAAFLKISDDVWTSIYNNSLEERSVSVLPDLTRTVLRDAC